MFGVDDTETFGARRSMAFHMGSATIVLHRSDIAVLAVQEPDPRAHPGNGGDGHLSGLDLAKMAQHLNVRAR